MKNPLLIVFAKAPRAGAVKTRLSPPLSPRQASAVHEASLKDVVHGAVDGHAKVHLRHAGGEAASRWFAHTFPDVPRSRQGNGDLGDRLDRAFGAAFRHGAPAVAIVGSDAPTLPPRQVARAFESLSEADLVLGPAHDGGYYLIGLRRSAWPDGRSLFDSIPWSTSRVMRKTLDNLARLPLRAELLREWYDIDRPEDLYKAARDAAPTSHLGRLLRGELAEIVASNRPGKEP